MAKKPKIAAVALRQPLGYPPSPPPPVSLLSHTHTFQSVRSLTETHLRKYCTVPYSTVHDAHVLEKTRMGRGFVGKGWKGEGRGREGRGGDFREVSDTDGVWNWGSGVRDGTGAGWEGFMDGWVGLGWVGWVDVGAAVEKGWRWVEGGFVDLEVGRGWSLSWEKVGGGGRGAFHSDALSIYPISALRPSRLHSCITVSIL